MDIKHGGLLSPKHPFPIQSWKAHLVDVRHYLRKLHDLRLIFTPCHQNRKELAHQFVKIDHLQSHTSCSKRILRNQLKSRIWLCFLRIVHDYSTFSNEFSFLGLKYRDHASIKRHVPIPLLIQICLDTLMLDAFGCKSISSTRSEGAQIVLV